MYYNNDSNLLTLVASASVDSTVRIWNRFGDFKLNILNEKNKKSNFNLEQIITVRANGFASALKFYLLPISKCNFIPTYLLI